MKWVEGRQGSGYFKKLILQGSFFDVYILKFPKGSEIDWHKDPVPNKKHFRFNIFLWNAISGGEFQLIDHNPIVGNRFFQLFRPDENYHRVTAIRRGTRFVLSFGVAL